MKALLIHVEGHGIGEYEWSNIPRIGEGIVLSGLARYFRVQDIVWEVQPDGLIARIRVRDPGESERDS
jgi:hypothetical protein